MMMNYIGKLIFFMILGMALLCSSTAYAVKMSVTDSSEFSSRLQHKVDNFMRTTPGVNQLITVVIESDASISDMDSVRLLRGDLRYKFGKRHEIQIPINKLPELKRQLSTSSHVRLPFPHAPLGVTSQGVDILGANDMHALNNFGQGVKIGVIDLGFANYALSQSTGDLPLSLSIIDYTNTGYGGYTHGTNVAEIVYDMAPAAELYLAKVGTIQQLQQAMLDMNAAGVKIINHSVGWFGAAFYDGTGDICDTTNQAESYGIQWVNAMGNSRNAHYLGDFLDADSNLQHEFKAGQNYNAINLTAGVTNTLILNWDDYPRSRTDYNLYLYDDVPDSGGVLVASSENRQSGGGWYPYEEISYTAAVTATHYIVVSKKSASTANIPLTLFSLGPSLSVKTTASSLVQPADCASVLSVGAVSLNDSAESFSSEGPTTNGLQKPEIAATDRTVTSLSSSFAGTSGSSPHAAGAAALVLAQNPTYTPLQLRNRLISTARDVSVAGYDYRTGYGRISLDADQDLVNHDDDNCPLITNSNQLDTDSDIQGNACDLDDDNDGLSDALELVIGSNTLLVDTDGDGLDDYYEVAFDGDAYQYTSGVDLNPSSADTDGDGLGDASDSLPIVFNYMDGDLAPLGSPDGVLNVADYIIARRITQGELTPTSLELSHGDLYPLGSPDGQMNNADLINIYQKILQ